MQLRRSRALWFVLGTAVGLAGCANVDFETQQAWFSKPLDLSGRNSGYSFSELQESKQRQRPISANDLVNSSGGCPAPAAAPAAVAAGPGVQPTAPQTDANALLGTGVALGMSECDVVARAGAPSSVQIGKTPNGGRAAVLTYSGGPRPGVYHFEGGALTAMDRVAAPTPEVAEKKKPAKSAKSGKPQKKNDT